MAGLAGCIAALHVYTYMYMYELCVCNLCNVLCKNSNYTNHLVNA